MKLVEVEGSHTLQNIYSSLDVHLAQCYSVLITADQPAMDYFIVVSTRFTSSVLTTTAILHYSNSAGRPVGAPPGGPTIQIDWSLNQARSIRYCCDHSSKVDSSFWFVWHLCVSSYPCKNQVESDSQRTETKSTGFISLRPRQHNANHQACKLCTGHQWQAEICGQ